MSRITRWKPEKAKTKVVFRLQFHATHIPQSGWDKIFITFIPADSGKATAKTTKANVRNGACKWADPIYETTRLLQDLRTKQFDEKLYKFVVSMGSSRSSLLGEAAINLADYADALKPSSVVLPLHGSDSGAILHVTVQLLTSKTGFREFEQQRELRERGLQTTSDHNSRNESVSGRLSSPREGINDNAENPRINSKPQLGEHPSHEEDTSLNEDHVGSPITFDGSSNTSGSLYADKHDTACSHEINAQNSDQKYPSTHGTHDWIHSWGSELSGDNDIAIAYDESSRLRGSLESAESSLQDLKLELSSLQGHADELGMEAQKFAQQLAAEMASGENLAREVAILKTECSKFKREIEVLKDNSNKLRSPNCRDSTGNIEEPIYQDLQLRWLKGLLLVEDKLQELQNKARFGFNDMDTRVLASDLESMLTMLKDLKQGTGQVISSLNFVTPEGGPALKENEEDKSRFGLGTDLYQPESMLHHSADVTNLMKNRVDELMRELEESKAEKQSLVQKMGQMECYYEALIQELEGNQRHMLEELQNLRNEHSACLYAVSSTNAEMERMRQDMNDKLILFTEEKRELDGLNKGFERRAVTAEAALKRARLNYSIAVGQLQKDLELLSSQVSSMYESNQNLIKEAFQDTQEVNTVGAPKNRALVQKKQTLGGEALLDDLRRSLNLQEELYRKVEDEVRDMHHENLYLDILSRTVQGILLEAVSDMGEKMNEKDEMTKQLGIYKKSTEVLMLKLQTALDEFESLNKEKTALSAEFHEMTRLNENLGASLQSVNDEKGCLVQKIAELEDLLRKEMEESSDLKNGNVTMKEKLMNLTVELQKLEHVKENLEKRVSNLQEEMQGILRGHDEKFCLLKEAKENLAKEKEMAHASMSISESARENLQKVVRELQEKMQAQTVGHDERLARLMEEVEVLTKQRDAACASMSISESAKENLEKVVRELQEKIQAVIVGHDERLTRLIEEVEVLTKERDAACVSMSISESAKENLEKVVRELQEKMQALMVGQDERFTQLTEEVEVLTKERDASCASMSISESAKENLEKVVHELQEKMQALMVGQDERFTHLTEEVEVLTKERDAACASMSISESAKENLEKAVHELQEKMQALMVGQDERLTQLTEEVEVLTKERDAACVSLGALGSAKENLEEVVTELRQKLLVLLTHHDEKFAGASLDLSAIVLQLGEFQDTAQQKISGLRGEIDALATERDEARASLGELGSAKENLQKLVDNLEEKLRGLVKFHDKNYEGTSLDLFDLVSQIEEFQHNVNQRLVHMLGENVALAKERDVARASLSSSESEKENLKNSVSELQEKLQELLLSHDEKVETLSQLGEFRNITSHKISELIAVNEVLERERDSAQSSSCQLVSDNEAMKEKFECDLHDVLAKINTSDSLVHKLQSELEIIAGRLRACLEDEEAYEEQQRVLIADLHRLEAQVGDVGVKNGDFAQEILSLQSLGEGLAKSRLAEEKFAKENHSLMASLQEKIEESACLVSELTELRESLRCLDEELRRERSSREELENMITNLTSQLNETHSQLSDGNKQNLEIVELRQLVSNLELEKLRMGNLLSEKEECIKMHSQEAFSNNQLEDQLFEMHDHLVASDTRIIFAQAQYRALIEDVVQQLKHSERNLSDLQEKNLDMESRLISSLANEVELNEENAELSRKLELLRAELEAAVAQNGGLVGSYDALALELEEHRQKNEVLDGSLSEERKKHGLQIEKLMQRLASSEEEMDSLAISNEELKVGLLVLKDKLRECCGELTLLEEEYKELNERLSSQCVKTEEFKNLSSHLKELKDKAEAECAKVREKKEADSSSFAVQESLRIAFIKEQYESKVQELKQQLSMSKKHSEEMLLKLQDAVDEIENRKRTEASNLRRNEELSMKILDLESELQEIVSDKREKANAYDCMKAEMECSLISLECCKEEKQKLEASLQQCHEGKSKIEAELSQVKELFESLKTQSSISETSLAEMPNGERRSVDRSISLNHDETDSCSSSTAGIETKQGFVSSGENGVRSLALVNGENFLHGEGNDFVLVSDPLKVQGLRSSMENLNKELEKMKNENWILPQEDHQVDNVFPDLERELIQLDKANQELGSIYPSFNDFGGGGNALERVLALELELASALQAKKSSIFQSSFLRQHSDEAAIFKSFKDINELIKDMLEMKGRYSAVESELKEMHGRYSQLSVQFAEVEGERQKLMMTLKCVRTPKKALSLHRTSSASLGENS